MIKIHNFVKISQLLQREKQIKDSSSPNNSYGNNNLFASPSRFIRKLKIKKILIKGPIAYLNKEIIVF